MVNSIYWIFPIYIEQIYAWIIYLTPPQKIYFISFFKNPIIKDKDCGGTAGAAVRYHGDYGAN